MSGDDCTTLTVLSALCMTALLHAMRPHAFYVVCMESEAVILVGIATSFTPFVWVGYVSLVLALHLGALLLSHVDVCTVVPLCIVAITALHRVGRGGVCLTPPLLIVAWRCVEQLSF